MADREKVIKGLECCASIGAGIKTCGYIPTQNDCPYAYLIEEDWNGCDSHVECTNALASDALKLLKEQEPRELTKEEWERWKKDERRDPICMIFYGDTTPFWVLRPESINEPLYLMGKIKLFTKKPLKGQVKWDE